MTTTPEPTRPRAGTEPFFEERTVRELSGDLRGLALALVGDEAEADDLVQEAWLAALAGPARRVRDAKAWLRGVVRNLAFKRRYRSDRRADVEALSAAPERLEPSDGPELESALDLLRRTVGDLRDPYRSVLTQRFFDGRTMHEIAVAAGCPYQTVKSQLRRGIGQLRDDLDRRHDGNRAAWCGVLLPLAGRTRRDAATIAAGDSAAARSGWSGSHGWLAAALPILLGAILLWSAAGLRGADMEPSLPAELATASAPPPPTVIQEDRARVSGTPAAREDESAQTPAPADTPVIEVVVLDPDGEIVPEAVVTVIGASGREEHRVERGASLRIPVSEVELHGDLLPGLGDSIQLMARAPGGAWSFRYTVAVPAEGRHFELVTRGRGQTLTGRVVDASQSPVVGARVTVDGDLVTTPGVEDGATFLDPYFMTETDEQGSFELEGLPVRLHRLRVSAPGLATAVSVVEGEDEQLEQLVVLAPGGRARGELRLPDGGPAAGAIVRVSEGMIRGRAWVPETRSDAQGRYELTGLVPGRRRVFAQAEGDDALWTTAVLDVAAGAETTWNTILERRPGLRVRIFHPDGEPVVDGIVVTGLEDDADPWWGTFGRTDAEGLATFAQVADGPLRVLVRRDADDAGRETELSNVVPSENDVVVKLEPRTGQGRIHGVLPESGERRLVVGSSGVPTFRVEVAADGTFESKALEPGSYRLWTVVEGHGAFACGERVVLPDETIDLGQLVPPPLSRLVLDWGDAPASPEDPWLLETEEICSSRKLVRTLSDATNELELYPGGYRLRRADEETTGLEFVLDEGVELRLNVR